LSSAITCIFLSEIFHCNFDYISVSKKAQAVSGNRKSLSQNRARNVQSNSFGTGSAIILFLMIESGYAGAQSFEHAEKPFRVGPVWATFFPGTKKRPIHPKKDTLIL
jgi:hypothetical protein